MVLHIRNMICTRCKILVQSELERLGYDVIRVELGRVEIRENLTPQQRQELNEVLMKANLELIEDKKRILADRIRQVITEMIRNTDEFQKVKYSVHISESIGMNYTYLSNIFSEVTGSTIEQFIIRNKIERVKELLAYDEYSLTQISYKLDYSSVAHLSNQFKKVTGMTASQYRKMKLKKRQPLDELADKPIVCG